METLKVLCFVTHAGKARTKWEASSYSAGFVFIRQLSWGRTRLDSNQVWFFRQLCTPDFELTFGLRSPDAWVRGVILPVVKAESWLVRWCIWTCLRCGAWDFKPHAPKALVAWELGGGPDLFLNLEKSAFV